MMLIAAAGLIAQGCGVSIAERHIEHAITAAYAASPQLPRNFAATLQRVGDRHAVDPADLPLGRGRGRRRLWGRRWVRPSTRGGSPASCADGSLMHPLI